jgi:hypothetical protein
MLPGALVLGHAVLPDGSTALGSAAVRLYEPGVTGPTPILRGQTRTDGSGDFRIVIPISP